MTPTDAAISDGAGHRSDAASTMGGAGGGALDASGSGGAAPDAADAATGSRPNCRTYATQYTFDSSLGAHYSYACSHSEASGFDRSCKISKTTDVEHWDSKSDFIDEAAAIGITKIISYTQDDPPSLTTYEYDTQHRLFRIVSGGSLYSTYDAWDDLGRPVHFVYGPGCGNAEATLSYGANTITTDVASGPCKAHNVGTYDSDGMHTSYDYGNGTTATYTTTGRATVCR